MKHRQIKNTLFSSSNASNDIDETTAAIIELLDYSLPEYDQNINFYRELGFSENDYTILKEVIMNI